MITSTAVYTANILITESRYRLSKDSVQLIGKANMALAKKIKLDQTTGTYRFNAENISPDMTNESDPAKIAALLASQKQQTGGGGQDTKNLYSLDLPVDPKMGTTMYDSNTKSSFKIIPEFSMDTGRTEDGRVVYPVAGGGQAVYSVKGNGVKEDIVLTKPRGDQLSLSYKLELPKTLTARLDAQGNLGVYSVDPAVTSAVADALQNSAGTDTARLKDVQENGDKSHLAYLIPAPTILQSGDHPHGHTARASYKLVGNTLTVNASNLSALTYPISIDPSVVVTSTSDFATGNSEGNISFDAGAISRGGITGGSVGAWSATTSLATPRHHITSVIYNNNLYSIGGYNNGTYYDEVRYAPINADGTIGAWTATTAMPVGRYSHASIAYNGYLYVMGGYDGTITRNDTLYAPINADGTIGAWTATTNLPFTRNGETALVNNGYLYIVGGYDSTANYYTDVQYTPINADGTIGSWTATTGFTTGRRNNAALIYNGYMYILGGYNVSTYYNDVQYAPITTNGTLGTWKTATSFTTGRSDLAAAVYGGYVYIFGGSTGGAYQSDVQYAPINADGSIGTWTATTSFAGGRSSQAAVAYNNHLYTLGGLDGAFATIAEVQVATIDATAPSSITMGNWATTTSLGAGTGSTTARVTTRTNHGSVAYNGYIYVIGGTGASATQTSVHYAPLNANGTVGTWLVGSVLPAARAGLSATASNGYMYAIGGQDSSGVFTASSYYAQINADGSLGTWTPTTSLTSIRSDEGVEIYNGRMYVTGGVTTGAAKIATVEYITVNANGSLGTTWTATTSLPLARGAHGSAVYNGFLYVFGGSDGTSSTTPSPVLFAPINANGTIGSWSNTTAMTSKRVYFDVRIYQGYAFAVGGYDGASIEYNTTSYAKFNADGTIGQWTDGTSFTTGRDSQGTEIYNGYIYITGGWNGTTKYGDVQYAQLSYGPPASTVGSVQTWQSATPTTSTIYGHSSIVYNDYVYIIGGFGGGAYRPDVKYAPINADGTIGTWTATSSLTLGRFNAAAAVYNGYLYVSAGQTNTSVFSNTIEYSKINADGSLGAWQASGNTVTTARYGHESFAYNGKLYVIGGGDAANVALGDVKYATINADGSIGAFADTTATTAERDTAGFIYGGRIYITGGVNGSTYANTIRYASINADGTLSSWTTNSASFTTARSRHAVVAVNGYAYLSGGANAGGLSDLQYAPINADGSIGTWKTGNNLTSVAGAPTTYYYHTMVTDRGKLYSLAGINASSVEQTASYVVGVNAPALKGVYSKLIDLGQPATLNNITTNGGLPLNQTIVSFRVAGTDGVFGSWQPVGVLSSAPPTNVKYVMYKIAFDDSNDSSLASTSGRSSATDITFDYTLLSVLTPDNRLRHNKYFDNSGILQPLQTP